MQIVTLTDVEQRHSSTLVWTSPKKKRKKERKKKERKEKKRKENSSFNNKSYNKRNVVDYAKPGPHAGQLNRFSFQRNNQMPQQKTFCSMRHFGHTDDFTRKGALVHPVTPREHLQVSLNTSAM